MPMTYTPGRTNFGLLPEPERSTASFVTSSVINLGIVALILYIGATAKHVIEEHQYEMTELIVPTTPPPQPKVKVPPPPKLPPPPQPPKLQMEAPKITMPKPKPEPKPIQMEAKLALPVVKAAAKPAIILAPQPKAALTAAMPAQNPQVKPSTAPVHLGQTFGVTPNPNATRPATIAAIGNPYGGMQGPAVAPHGVVGSTGIGNGLKSGSNAGMVGRVASAGIPGATGNAEQRAATARSPRPAFPASPLSVAAQQPLLPPRSPPISKSFQNPRAVHLLKPASSRSRAMSYCALPFWLPARSSCKAWCMVWATGSMKRLAAWRNKYDSVPPPATDRPST